MQYPAHLGMLRLGRHSAALGRFDAHHVIEQRIHRHVGQQVDALGQTVERVHELGVAFPVPGQRRLHRSQRDGLGAHHGQHRALALLRFDRREAEAAVADHDRGDTVPGRNRQIRIPENLGVVMGVEVDEARGDNQPAGIDDLGCLVGRYAPNLGNSAVFDTHIAAKARRTGTVDDHPVLND